MPNSGDEATVTQGLSSQEAAHLLRQHGANELPKPPKASRIRVLLRQFAGPLVMMLIVAGGIALALGEVVDGLAIAAIVVLNAGLGYVQEWRAEMSLDALRQYVSPTTVAIRDGRETRIEAREIVPGDLLVLSEGDRIAADAIVQREFGLNVDESILTGESVPVAKPSESPVFSGTTVTSGHAEALVTQTGAATEFGRVAQMAGAVEDDQSPLVRQFARLARQLGWMAVFVAAIIGLVGYLQGLSPLTVLMLGLSMAVAMVPEGLPAVVTVTLALGATAMARRKALVRRLQAVETLGAASVICTDKTGTLTENRMTAQRVWALSGLYEVTGRGYDPTGHIEKDGKKLRAADDPLIARLCQVSLGCTHAALEREANGWHGIGDPTEIALIVLAQKAWAPPVARDSIQSEAPFTSDRKRMSVLQSENGRDWLLLKGAPEAVFDICTGIVGETGPVDFDPELERQARSAAADLAGEGLRVLALAFREAGAQDVEERDMVLIGLVGLIDPPRKEVGRAIAEAKAAGIRTIMITGDHPETARNVANQLGIEADTVLTGDEIEALGDDALAKMVSGSIAFARVAPHHKLRIVDTLQEDDAIVAMTGDGVNDAPALRKADIGIAMGIRGTEVAKDASDLILLDDNYATIVRAIAEGRRQYANIRNFVHYLLASNAGEVVALLINIVMLSPLIFLPVQILWMNLITDGVTAVALGLEPGQADQMKEAPRKPRARILNLKSAMIIVAFGLYTGAASLFIFEWLLPLGTDLARTAAFTGMVIFEKVSVFAFRSFTVPVHRLRVFSNTPLIIAFAAMVLLQVVAVYWPPLQIVMHTVPLRAEDWGLIALFALPLIVVPEVVKTIRASRP